MATPPKNTTANDTHRRDLSAQPGNGEATTHPALELKQFRVLYELAIALVSGKSLPQNLQLAVDRSRRLFEADTAYIALRDASQGDVYMHSLCGIRTDCRQKGLRSRQVGARPAYLPIGQGVPMLPTGDRFKLQ